MMANGDANSPTRRAAEARRGMGVLVVQQVAVAEVVERRTEEPLDIPDLLARVMSMQIVTGGH